MQKNYFLHGTLEEAGPADKDLSRTWSNRLVKTVDLLSTVTFAVVNLSDLDRMTHF